MKDVPVISLKKGDLIEALPWTGLEVDRRLYLIVDVEISDSTESPDRYSAILTTIDQNGCRQSVRKDLYDWVDLVNSRE